ncbi:MAG: TIGR02449 family protein [Porticoccaceae bacterium]|nr:TIGR02449 family protein [Pseudomonadales bacterium]
MNDSDLNNLEQKIDRMINLCARLQQENQSLRERESSLLKERSKLLEKNEMARNRVETMISRLKGLNNEGSL